MIVIDASALIKYLLKEPGREVVERYLIAGTCSVDHLVKEVSNAIWKHTTLYRRISEENARALFAALFKLIEEKIVLIEPQEKYVHQAFEIALNNEITIYDALYIAQAKANNAKLLTSDKKQANVARGLGIAVHQI